MASAPSSTSRSAFEPPDRPQQPRKPPVDPKRRRDKPQLSCNVCRKRKSKCNRGRPCESCVKKGLEQHCIYPDNAGIISGPQQTARKPTGVQERIDELERQVVALMNRVQGAGSSPERRQFPNPPACDTVFTDPDGQHDEETYPSPSDPSFVSNDFGRLDLANSQAHYVENSHWSAILDRIADIRDHCDNESDLDGHSSSTDYGLGSARLGLPVGSSGHARHQEILAAMPSKQLADVLIEQYMKILSVSHVMIHPPTFMAEYDRFWDSPADTPIMWVGLLFGMLSLGAVYWRQSLPAAEAFATLPLGVDPQYLTELYKKKLLQCLALGDYTKGPSYTLETMMHYMHIAYIQTEDTDISMWVTLGTLVRLAQRMGYHRDGSHFPRMSPFQAEMRRRVWLVIYELDVSVSLHFGLPRIINPIHCDTALPRNLLEEDIDSEMTTLPPSRPGRSETNTRFVIMKHWFLVVLAEVADSTILPGTISCAHIIELDNKLQELHDQIYAMVRLQIVEDLNFEHNSPKVLIRRLLIELVYHKTRLLMYRSYMTHPCVGDEYARARKTCIESAINVLKFHRDLHIESQPGGKLVSHWKMSSLMRQDFLLATTILCHDLDQHIITKDPSEDFELEGTEIKALGDQYDIWIECAAKSREARRVLGILQVVLSKARKAKYPGTEALGAYLEHDLDKLDRGQDLSQADVVGSDGPPWLANPSIWGLGFSNGGGMDTDLGMMPWDPGLIDPDDKTVFPGF